MWTVPWVMTSSDYLSDVTGSSDRVSTPLSLMVTIPLISSDRSRSSMGMNSRMHMLEGTLRWSALKARDGVSARKHTVSQVSSRFTAWRHRLSFLKTSKSSRKGQIAWAEQHKRDFTTTSKLSQSWSNKRILSSTTHWTHLQTSNSQTAH